MATGYKSAAKNVKLRVAVMMGGPSSEHEVSLNTGKMVLQHLNSKKYTAQFFTIGRDGRWPMSAEKLKKDFDLVFNAMHGEYGEDGTVQEILEKIGIPFTGADSQTSRLSMNKVACYKLFKKAKLTSPLFTTNRDLSGLKKLGLPLVVKPVDRGSSVGVSIIHQWKDLPDAIKEAEKFSTKVMFEKFIAGKELTCGVVQIKSRPVALVPTEIIPINRPFFDYEAKYTPGASKEITPPNLPEKLIKQVQKTALKVHDLIGRNGYSRTDFIFGQDGQFYVLEINTLPGMTANSLVPQGAQAASISFPQLLDIIIEAALKYD